MINYNTKYIIIIIKPYTVIPLRCAFPRTSVVDAIFFALVRSVEFFSHHTAPMRFFCRTSAVAQIAPVQCKFSFYPCCSFSIHLFIHSLFDNRERQMRFFMFSKRKGQITKSKQKFDNCNCKMSSFTEEDRQQLQEINSSFKKLLLEVANLKNDFAIYKQKLSKAEIVNERLRQQLNLSLYKTDALKQYGRRENLRIYIVPESNSNIDDGEKMALHIAKEMNISLTDMAIYFASVFSTQKKTQR